ncbi:hypothetical protein BDN72DRAFT_879337 [Pluteus cervinus]|uniref:Uncharacterized protein n=1 Tax=Pluteus cervinus TaxID=181527 RepID=A0ACD3AQF2_9AGAR|nr:hypothetical protein BDN72DRAFT_879337 [Pluteus cervinus]
MSSGVSGGVLQTWGVNLNQQVYFLSSCPPSTSPMSSLTSPQYEKVEDDSFDPYALPNLIPSVHLDQQTQNSDHGRGGSKSSESDRQSEWHEQSTAGRTSAVGRMVSLVKFAILPIVSAAYLGFCYTVQKRIVVVDGKGVVDTSPERLSEFGVATIKSGITSISILMISLGLWPLKGLLDDLKQEEFFRVLNQRPQGVPLSVINDIASASLLRSTTAIVKRKVSPYFFAAFVAGLVTLVVSTLAPAALSVESVILDNDLVALQVGAIPAGSIINTTNPRVSLDVIWSGSLSAISTQSDQAASLAWAEIALGVHYQFTADDRDNETYLVPFPSNLSTDTQARWLSDVMVVSPDCQWLQTNITNGLTVPFNLSDLTSPTLTVNVPTLGINIDLPLLDPSADGTASLRLVDGLKVKNATTKDPADGGRMVWTVAQCKRCRPADLEYARVSLDLSSIPTFELSGPDAEMQVGVLGCIPNLRVETREVRSVGGGSLVVFPDRYKSQGNIHPAQAAFLLSTSASGIADKAGPYLGPVGLGTQVAATFAFGNQVNMFNDTNQDKYVWTPAPLSNITQAYRQFLRSTTKPFLDGALGTVYVPGRTSRRVIIFTSSAPYTAVSTAFLILLSAMVAFAHFRKGKGEIFTLFSVAAALDKSEVIPQFAQFKKEQHGMTGQLLDDTVHEAWGQRTILLRKDFDGKTRLEFGSDSLE